MGALAEIYSAGNRAKRNLRDVLNNPLAALEQLAGQWRDESPKTLEEIRQRTFNPTQADIDASVSKFNPSALGGALGVIKQKGGNWLAGSVEDALRGLKRPSLADYQTRYPSIPASEAMAQEFLPNTTINNWIEGPLTKYVKSRMATPEDEVRKLAEQGVLHVQPEQLYPGPQFDPNTLLGHRVGVGGIEAKDLLGQSAPAKAWENAADFTVGSRPVKAYTDPQSKYQSFSNTPSWMLKANPEDTVYHLQDRNSPGQELGFSHLIDELSNALNPASGLPRHLQLSPEAMQNLSMEKAVRRVANINAWRAAQKAEANRALAEKASMVREYAENNPKGLRWVELKRNVQPNPQNWSELSQAEQLAITDTREAAERQALADQLKYEGDTMGHCVGGYCDDVLEGRSRIFSLRDANGEPHVTIEVKPESRLQDAQAQYSNYYGERASTLEDLNNFLEENTRTLPLTEEEFLAKNEPIQIAQIKGSGKKDPSQRLRLESTGYPENKDAYLLPFVQDFVRNSPLGQPWSEVGDLGNTGLRRSRDIWNDLEQAKIREAGHTLGDYVTPEEKKAIVDSVWPGQWGEYADGGSVASSINSVADGGESVIMPSIWDSFFAQGDGNAA